MTDAARRPARTRRRVGQTAPVERIHRAARPRVTRLQVARDRVRAADPRCRAVDRPQRAHREQQVLDLLPGGTLVHDLVVAQRLRVPAIRFAGGHGHGPGAPGIELGEHLPVEGRGRRRDDEVQGIRLRGADGGEHLGRPRDAREDDVARVDDVAEERVLDAGREGEDEGRHAQAPASPTGTSVIWSRASVAAMTAATS